MQFLQLRNSAEGFKCNFCSSGTFGGPKNAICRLLTQFGRSKMQFQHVRNTPEGSKCNFRPPESSGRPEIQLPVLRNRQEPQEFHFRTSTMFQPEKNCIFRGSFFSGGGAVQVVRHVAAKEAKRTPDSTHSSTVGAIVALRFGFFQTPALRGRHCEQARFRNRRVRAVRTSAGIRYSRWQVRW